MIGRRSRAARQRAQGRVVEPSNSGSLSMCTGNLIPEDKGTESEGKLNIQKSVDNGGMGFSLYVTF